MDTKLVSDICKYFETQPVLKAWVFGSVARGEDGPDSDIDILVLFDPKARVSLLDHSAMICDLEERLSRKVDLVKEGTLLPFAVASADRDKQLIYERTA